eukprot:jgi/Chlat1/751/Chrsp104S01229
MGAEEVPVVEVEGTYLKEEDAVTTSGVLPEAAAATPVQQQVQPQTQLYLSQTQSAAADAARERVRKAFALFETKEKKNEVDEREIPTIVRSLGLNPTQDQLRDILHEVRGEDNTTGVVAYDRFEKCMLRVLLEQMKDYTRDTEATLLRAFQGLDPEGRGYIDGETFKSLMVTLGDTFRPEEVTDMMQVAVDEETGKVWYEDYVEMLARSGREDAADAKTKTKPLPVSWG